jgi:hypothetical protein
MSTRSPKSKRRNTALSALGIAGVSLALAGGASASTSKATANVPSNSQSHEIFQIFLGEEEISDVTLATFYVFDKENTGSPSITQQLRLARCGGSYRRGNGCGRGGACGGCGGCAGCGGGGANTNGGCGGGVDNYP